MDRNQTELDHPCHSIRETAPTTAPGDLQRGLGRELILKPKSIKARQDCSVGASTVPRLPLSHAPSHLHPICQQRRKAGPDRARAGSLPPAHNAFLLLTGVPSALNLGSSPTPSTQHPTPLPPSLSFFPSGRGIPSPTATPLPQTASLLHNSNPAVPSTLACRLRRVCPIWGGPARAGAANNGPASPQRRQPPHTALPIAWYLARALPVPGMFNAHLQSIPTQ